MLPYYLHEETGWSLSVDDLKSQTQKVQRGGLSVSLSDILLTGMLARPDQSTQAQPAERMLVKNRGQSFVLRVNSWCRQEPRAGT